MDWNSAGPIEKEYLKRLADSIVLTIEIFPAAAGSRESNPKTIIYNPNRGDLLPLTRISHMKSCKRNEIC